MNIGKEIFYSRGNIEDENKYLRWMLLVVSSLYPCAILLFFYNQNSAYVPFKLVLYVCIILTFFTAGLWWLGLLWFKWSFSSFVLCFLVWTSVVAVSLFFDFLTPIFSHKVLLVIFVEVLFMICTLPGMFLRGKDKRGVVSKFFVVFVSVLFLLNLTIVLRNTTSETNINMVTKPQFMVSNDREKPNIYWIHCDGMLGFSAMEKYFLNPQQDFLDKLVEKGFEVNKNAQFESGHSTFAAIPALMCPNFFDSYLVTLLADNENARNRIFEEGVQTKLTQARLFNETILAFDASGYHTCSIGLMEQLYFPTTDSFYFAHETEYTDFFLCFYDYGLARMGQLSEEDALSVVQMHELADFLKTFCKPVAFIFDRFCGPQKLFEDYLAKADVLEDIVTDREMSQILFDSDAADTHGYLINGIKYAMSERSPKFLVIHSMIAHFPYVYDENGNAVSTEKKILVNDYPKQHEYASKVLINMVDMIIKNDPNAVIILQSDHGLHGNTSKDFENAFGSESCAVDLWNSVMSAVRVPEQYRNGEEKECMKDPLNISRYLINNFVGQNYGYR